MTLALLLCFPYCFLFSNSRNLATWRNRQLESQGHLYLLIPTVTAAVTIRELYSTLECTWKITWGLRWLAHELVHYKLLEVWEPCVTSVRKLTKIRIMRVGWVCKSCPMGDVLVIHGQRSSSWIITKVRTWVDTWVSIIRGSVYGGGCLNTRVNMSGTTWMNTLESK